MDVVGTALMILELVAGLLEDVLVAAIMKISTSKFPHRSLIVMGPT